MQMVGHKRVCSHPSPVTRSFFRKRLHAPMNAGIGKNLPSPLSACRYEIDWVSFEQPLQTPQTFNHALL